MYVIHICSLLRTHHTQITPLVDVVSDDHCYGQHGQGRTLNHLAPMQDAWDGYRANRNRILDHIQQNKIDNTIILSGDSHANWVSDLVRK